VKDGSPMAARQFSGAQLFGVICAIVLTVGILWMVNTESETETGTPQEFAFVEVEPEESIWGKMVPKSMAEQRNDRRLALQGELASLIEGISGISEAQVVLSLQESTGLGHRYVPSTACVTVTPATNARLSTNEIMSVTRLVASGVSNLLEDDVTIFDNRDGLICTGHDLPISPPQLNTESIRVVVAKAIGLNVATVQVDMVRPLEGELFTPWIDNKRPVIRLTLPRSWVTWRASQVGNIETVKENILHIAKTASAGSIIEISIVNDAAVVGGESEVVESSAKQWTMVAGLIALFLSGITVRRRKREAEALPVRVKSVSEEVAFIFSLPHRDARVAIDSLSGPRRQVILEAITDSETVPLIEVPNRTSPELIHCG
jgi:hypothetical protein